MQKRYARSGFSSFGVISHVCGIAVTREEVYMGYAGPVKYIPLGTVRNYFTIDPARASMSMGRVFIIDDEEHVRTTISLALTQGGYEVLEAADGAEAIAAIQSWPTGFSVHAIICDLALPKVNGHDLIAFIRATLPSVPVIVLTGHPDVQEAASLFKQGVVDYLIKPAQAQTLLDAVRRAIGEQAVFE